MCTHQDWFIRLSKLHCWAYFHWLFFFRGTGKERVVHQLNGGKLDLLKHLSSQNQVSFFPLLLFVFGWRWRWGTPRQAFWILEWAVKTFTAKNPDEKCTHKSIPWSNRDPNDDSFKVPFAHNLLILYSRKHWTQWKDQHFAAVFGSYVLVVSVNMHGKSHLIGVIPNSVFPHYTYKSFSSLFSVIEYLVNNLNSGYHRFSF